MPSIVVVNFFPAFTPASSGGELRLGKLYRALSKTYDVTMLTSTDFGARFEEVVHTPRLRELRFPKDDLWRNAYATLERSGIHGDLSGLAFALAVSDPDCRLRQVAREYAPSANAVVHEFPYSEPIFCDGCPVPEIYNSHNFEASLLSSIVRGEGFESALLKLIRLEGNLVARAHRVFATSTQDAEKFRLFYGADPAKLGVCPNGFDNEELKPVATARSNSRIKGNLRPQLLFTGSGHYPNVEAADYLIKNAGDLAECDIILAGGLCGAFANRVIPRNVVMFGPFGLRDKLRLLTKADLFLNPVVLGSGTSLKALEALGAGLPMVSTPEGVRGLELVAGTHCDIVPRDQFAVAVRAMLRDPQRREGIAATGLMAAREIFSWDRIATQLSQTIAEPIPDPERGRPMVLALNDYPVLEPGSGGIARVRNLLANIGCDVVLVSFGPAFEVKLISPGLLHATIPKTATHRAFEDMVNDRQAMSVNDGVASLFAGSNRALIDVVSAIALRAQAAIFEHPYMAPLMDALAAIRPDLPIIYSAHNIEATHKAQILRTHSIGTTLAAFIAELERRLVTASHLIVCCTPSDAEHFAASGKDIIVVPNGCELPDETALRDARDHATLHAAGPRLGFLGSSHGPNVEAADFIVGDLATAFPDAYFELIGGVCGALSVPVPSNVALHGAVSERSKTAIMARWDIALNPIESGGGSSLKLPDYLAHGLATLSTPAGARSFAMEERNAGLITARESFRKTLAEMLGDPTSLARQRTNARRYAADHLSWGAITSEYSERLRLLLTPAPAQATGQKLLIITYRYTEPPLGGAEEYLIEVLKRVRPRFQRIDLAAINVDHLTNRHHFACTMSSANGSTSVRLAELFDQALFFPPEQPPDAEVMTRARRLERAWTREEQELFAPFAERLSRPGRLRVFGGFFGPENHEGMVRRWTSPEFSFLVPATACTFQMSGYASMNKTLRLTLMAIKADGTPSVVATYQEAIGTYFLINVALPKAREARPLVLLCEVDEHQVPDDQRPFGILLSEASVLLGRNNTRSGARSKITALGVSTANLSELLDEELRTQEFDRWVTVLHDIALRRAPDVEADFAAVRGPHSPELQAWLADHATDYDAVLVQGIPFDIIPRTVETLAQLPRRPRVVTLPHFHGDDRFYHWRRYYESFDVADATLLFSSSVADRLGPAARFAVVPGGGVRADEHGDPAADFRFRKIYPRTTPFFLVLGRKTASKGYKQVIRAHQALRAFGTMVDLVLIGPDEDGLRVSGEGVQYLGRQPREVIRGALGACLGLVTMSNSESFGIVLCEAWLFSKPVIANNACHSFRELVRHQETGLLVTSDQELIGAMQRLAEDATERERMGGAGFNDVVQKYTWNSVTDAFMQSIVPTSG